MKTVVQTLYNLIVTPLEFQGTSSEDALRRDISNLAAQLAHLHRAAPSVSVNIPPDIIQYVEDGRNPDIYTREFVELVQRNNQRLKGKSDALAAFRDILAADIAGAMPEMRGEVVRVLESVGVGSEVLDREDGRTEDQGLHIKKEEGVEEGEAKAG
ncbi:transcription factor subunit Med10 of mediator complex-domain-containing protein [Lineolata rhizophorae]|uniref:Mediator of RNA polymerase II transcription subunit 10 n=1 Tax=Lineolata rhizophorae TaxID=578093 RepID=A0A6A6NVZ5_9PEZI|nr:transcription factor subunit Med10 of mediator complex-domain-containing protein [Lineolata rhizophorae]